MNNRHLFISDLDGTLLGPDSRISQRTAKILSRLSSDGALITVATARTPATVEPLLADCHLRLPAIVITGAAEWDFRTKRFENVKFIDADVADAVDVTCRQVGLVPLRYAITDPHFIDTYHIADTPPTPAAQKFINERKHLPLKRMHVENTPLPAEVRSHTVLFFATDEMSVVERAACALQNIGGCRISCYPDIYAPELGILEVYRDDVSKASAVQALARRIGATEVTVFGDNLNDLSMMAVADEAIAVSNAQPAVKEAAHKVIGSNSDDAVALYLNDIIT